MDVRTGGTGARARPHLSKSLTKCPVRFRTPVPPSLYPCAQEFKENIYPSLYQQEYPLFYKKTIILLEYQLSLCSLKLSLNFLLNFLNIY